MPICMRALFTLLLLAAASAFFLMCGTIRALPKNNLPAQYRLALGAGKAGAYAIRVVSSQTNEFPISPTGEVTIAVPALGRSCSLVCWGITLQDGSPFNRKVFELVRDGHVVRRLSLRQLEALPLDSSGARKLVL